MKVDLYSNELVCLHVTSHLATERVKVSAAYSKPSDSVAPPSRGLRKNLLATNALNGDASLPDTSQFHISTS